MDTTDIQAECYFAHLTKIAKLFSDFFEKKTKYESGCNGRILCVVLRL